MMMMMMKIIKFCMRNERMNLYKGCIHFLFNEGFH